MPYRLLDSIFECGDMYVFPNRLVGPGAGVDMHAHRYDHLMETKGGVGDVRYLLVARPQGRGEIRREMGPDEYAYIRAGTFHRMELISGDSGGFVCIFSKYGPNGERRPEPAEQMGGG